MYIYIYIYMYTYIYININKFIHTYIHTYTYLLNVKSPITFCNSLIRLTDNESALSERLLFFANQESSIYIFLYKYI
jgi:hypothetical protein